LSCNEQIVKNPVSVNLYLVLAFFSSTGGLALVKGLLRLSIRVSISPMPSILGGHPVRVKRLNIQSFSPTPANLIGFPVTAEQTAPRRRARHRQALVRITPSIPKRIVKKPPRRLPRLPGQRVDTSAPRGFYLRFDVF
jgi:hypothetical protein